MVTIKVLYKYIDGAHFFVSRDKRAAGLCVAHTNLEIAYNAVATALNNLFKWNHNQTTNFKPRISYDIFSKSIPEKPDDIEINCETLWKEAA